MTRTIEIRKFINHRGRPLMVQAIDEDGDPLMEVGSDMVKLSDVGSAVEAKPHLVHGTTILVVQHLMMKMPAQAMHTNDSRRYTQLMNKLDGVEEGQTEIELHEKIYKWLQSYVGRDWFTKKGKDNAPSVAVAVFGVDGMAVTWQLEDPNTRKPYEELLNEVEDE